MDIEHKKNDGGKQQKRRGAMFSTLAHVLRDIREIVFTSSFIMRNRPGLGERGSTLTGYVPVENMLEAYYKEPSIDKVNGLILGRAGDGSSRNTNLVEICATAREKHQNLELGYNNGVVKLRATREGENPPVDRSGVTVGDVLGFATGDLVPGVTVQVVGNGYWGGVVLSHITNKDDSPTSGATGGRYILINDEGIHIKGLPTSSPGGSGRLWNDGGTLKIT